MPTSLDLNAALDLLPSFARFSGITATIFLAIGAVAAWEKLPPTGSSRIKLALVLLLLAPIAGLSCLFYWTNGLEFGETVAMRTDKLCKSTGLTVYRRIDYARGVLLRLPQYKISPPRLPKHYPSQDDLFRWTSIDFVELAFGEQEKSIYTRKMRHFSATEHGEESFADIVVTIKTIATRGEMRVGIFGEELVISERKSNQTLARFRYFWSSEKQYCPTPRQGIETAMIISYVISPKNEHLRETFLP
jgi:hypothetical protein